MGEESLVKNLTGEPQIEGSPFQISGVPEFEKIR